MLLIHLYMTTVQLVYWLNREFLKCLEPTGVSTFTKGLCVYVVGHDNQRAASNSALLSIFCLHRIYKPVYSVTPLSYT